jgi:hypothetical protein
MSEKLVGNAIDDPVRRRASIANDARLLLFRCRDDGILQKADRSTAKRTKGKRGGPTCAN